MKLREKLLSKVMVGTSVLVLALGVGASADSRSVVTLGVDLSQEQKDAIMKYFGVTEDTADIIYINNQQERDALGSYIPLEQIGTRTFSCAMVSPTTSGGIQVKTANLNYVTCNMIASALSTSGVTNCQVLAASPFPVSGTGALTGITLAYEKAADVTIDPVKKDLANQEIIVTGTLADTIGQGAATAIVNATKAEVIEGDVTNAEDINNILVNISNEYNTELSEDDTSAIITLMEKIAEQEYNIAEMKANLAKVQANVIDETAANEELKQQIQEEAVKAAQEAAAQAVAQNAAPESENILNNTDISALAVEGETISESATDPETEPVQSAGDPIVDDQGNVTQTEPATEAVDVPVTPVDQGMPVGEGEVSETEASQTEWVAPLETYSTNETEPLESEWTDYGADWNIPQTEWSFPETEMSQITEAPYEDPNMVDQGVSMPDQTEIVPTGEPMTEAPVDTIGETEGETEAGMTISPEDYLIFTDIKDDLDMTLGTGEIITDDYSVVLSDVTTETALADIESYVVTLLAAGADSVAEKEELDEEISKTVLEDTDAIVEVKNYKDERMIQLDKYLRRYILLDDQWVFVESSLTDEDKVNLYDFIIKVFEERISDELVENDPAGQEEAISTEFMTEASVLN